VPTLVSDLFYADDLRLAKLLAVASVIAAAIAAFGIYVLGAFSERAPVGAWTLVAALLVAGAVALASTLRHALAALRIRPALALRE